MGNYFWPSDLELTDTASPLEILEEAKQEWVERSDGLLTLIIQETESTTSNHMLIVHAKHRPSSSTVTLFSVIHRPESPYPARIQPGTGELPEFLRKTSDGTSVSVAAAAAGVFGELLAKKWVCDTPSEFRSQLAEVFNLGSLKGDILGLVSRNRTLKNMTAKACTDSEHRESGTNGHPEDTEN
jgi:hypothetical protein